MPAGLILTLKLLMTPLLITAATLTGRRWGPAVSGWLIGFPLTSGPVSVILALQYGPPFAAHAAIGTVAGEVAVCLFCLVYSLAARRLPWPACAALGTASFLAGIFLWNQLTLTLLPACAALVVVVALLTRLLPQRALVASTTKPPAWDLPARMAVAVVFVLLLTSFATALGPQLSGLISPFPVFGLVLAVFAHRQHGPDAAIQFLRGVVVGSLAFGAFFLVVGALLTGRESLAGVYLLATLATLLVNGVSLAVTRRAAA